MKTKQILNIIRESLLVEDRKQKIIDVLVKRLGLSEEIATYLEEQMGKLAIWFANAVIKHYEQAFGMSKEKVIATWNPGGINEQQRAWVRKIVDWLRHPLAEPQELSNLSLVDALAKSEEFHSTLKALDGSIDYQETDTIIKRYPKDKSGKQYYWAYIPSSFCSRESQRMGHCGRTASGNNLFSLRSVRPIAKGQTVTDSHITISYGVWDGKIFQCKGKNNSKPKPEYYPYIFDFIVEACHFSSPGHFQSLRPFTGFESEYNSSNDYGWDDMTMAEVTQLKNLADISYEEFDWNTMSIEELVDMVPLFDPPASEFKWKERSDEDVVKLYGLFPEIFDSWSGKRRAGSLGLVADYQAPPTKFTIKIDDSEVSDYIDASEFNYTRKKHDGTTYTYDICYAYLSGDYFGDQDFYSDEDYQYWADEMNKKNEAKARQHIKHQLSGYTEEDLEERAVDLDSDDIEGLIKEFDEELDDLKRLINSCASDGREHDYHNHVVEAIKTALGELGTIKDFNYENLTLEIDLDNFNLDDEVIEEYAEQCNDNPECIFREALNREIDKPALFLDDRYSPSCDRNEFNDILSDRIEELDGVE
jgi:hypothetical protein